MRKLMVALVIASVASAIPIIVSAQPTTKVLSHHTATVSKADCIAVHQAMAANRQVSPELQAWGRNQSGTDCVLVSEITTQTSNGVLAWDGCYNRQSYEYFTTSLWPYPKIAQGTMNYGLCWTSSQIEVSWTSCWVSTFLGYGGGQNYCGGAPTSAGSWCAAEDDWYFYPYATPWWHQNHGFRDTWQAPLWMTDQQLW